MEYLEMTIYIELATGEDFDIWLDRDQNLKTEEDVELWLYRNYPDLTTYTIFPLEDQETRYEPQYTEND